MYINHRYNRFLNSIFLIASHDSALSNINLFHYSREGLKNEVCYAGGILSIDTTRV